MLTPSATRSSSCTNSPRLRLFDRPPADEGSICLGTGLWWRAAEPKLGDQPASDGELQEILANMPAVELFDVAFVTGQEQADYPFTSAFYESAAYTAYRKVHFPDLILPRTMQDAAGPAGGAQRQFLLWDARFLLE